MTIYTTQILQLLDDWALSDTDLPCSRYEACHHMSMRSVKYVQQDYFQRGERRQIVERSRGTLGGTNKRHEKFFIVCWDLNQTFFFVWGHLAVRKRCSANRRDTLFVGSGLHPENLSWVNSVGTLKTIGCINTIHLLGRDAGLYCVLLNETLNFKLLQH